MDFLIAFLALLLDALPTPGVEGGDGARAEANAALTIPLAPASHAAPGDPPVSGARAPGRPIVVIDAGHGGRDPGATSPRGEAEKHVTLAIARAIRDELVASGRVRVALTRNDDRFIVLKDRYAIARRLGARLFISIHADAAPGGDSARGATIYTLSEVASDKEAALLAARQNASDTIAGAEFSVDPSVNRILIDLAQRESMNVSADFARLLHREASPFFPFRAEYHRFASLIVLKAPDIPSILFESGYLTNPVDAAYIHSSEGQKQIAVGMRRAIEAHFARSLVDTSIS